MVQPNIESVVELRGISKRYGETQANADIDFDFRAGEVHVLPGENGAGKTTLMNVMFGHTLPDFGTIRVNGENAEISSPSDALALGIGMVHQHFSLVFSRRGVVDWNRINTRAWSLLEEYDVRPTDPTQIAGRLSGGNQQKVVLARELSREPKVLIADNPTWGLDVGAIDYVHRRLLEVKERGGAVLLLSLDLEELLKLSDRVLVLYRGKNVLERQVHGLSMDDLAMAMAGRSAA